MRKLALILLGLCFITSCGNKTKEKDYSIKYNGPMTINIAQKDDYKLNVSSDDALSYYSDDVQLVTVSQDGTIHGKSIGETDVVICNSEKEIKIHVIVSLFVEPTLDFGCDRNKILSLYNSDKLIYNSDSVVIYGNWYSDAVWSMAFFFDDRGYHESDLYIRQDLDIRIDEYLNEKYHPHGVLTDDDGTEMFIYLNAAEKDDATVLVCKIYDANEEKDICLVYIPYPSLDGRSTPLPFRKRERWQ